MVFILLDLSSLYETLINDLQNNLAFPLNNPMNQSFYFIIIIKVSEVFFHSKWIWLLILEFFSSFHQNTASFFSSYFSMEECCRGCLYKKLILEIKHKCPLLRVVKTWVTKRGSKFIQRANRIPRMKENASSLFHRIFVREVRRIVPISLATIDTTTFANSL